MSYGKRLKRLRKERWMTLAEASDFLGIPASTLGGYENEFRKPSLEVLAGIAEKYNVSADYILGLSEDRDIKKVESNIFEYFQKEGINYKGVPLTREELKPIEAILEMVIRDRLPTLDNDDEPKNSTREYYAL